jgi:hypothetical protein
MPATNIFAGTQSFCPGARMARSYTFQLRFLGLKQ